MKKGIKSKEKQKDPIAPEIVLFGLIFISFFPLNILPIVNPPISVKIEINMEKYI